MLLVDHEKGFEYKCDVRLVKWQMMIKFVEKEKKDFQMKKKQKTFWTGKKIFLKNKLTFVRALFSPA